MGCLVVFIQAIGTSYMVDESKCSVFVDSCVWNTFVDEIYQITLDFISCLDFIWIWFFFFWVKFEILGFVFNDLGYANLEFNFLLYWWMKKLYWWKMNLVHWFFFFKIIFKFLYTFVFLWVRSIDLIHLTIYYVTRHLILYVLWLEPSTLGNDIKGSKYQ